MERVQETPATRSGAAPGPDGSTGNVELRAASLGDIDGLRRVYRRASLSNAADREALLANPHYLEFDGSALDGGATTLATIGGEIVGFVTVIDAGSPGPEVEDLFVDPDWQRHGIGRLLMRSAADVARSRGRRVLTVTGNPHAEAFYRSVGFVPIGEAATAFGMAPRFEWTLPD